MTSDFQDKDQKKDNVIDISTIAKRDAIRKEQQDKWVTLDEKAAAEKPLKQKSEPIINLPAGTKYLLGIFILLHVVSHWILDPPQRHTVFTYLGFIPASYTDGGVQPLWSMIIAPFSYAFLHGNLMHLAINGLMLAAFGTGLERLVGARRMFLFFVVCSVIAVCVQFALSPRAHDVVIGASGGLSGFFAAILVLMQASGQVPKGKYGIWPIAIIWIIISVIFGFLGMPGDGGASIAWAAHLGGFIAGLLLTKPLLLRNFKPRD